MSENEGWTDRAKRWVRELSRMDQALGVLAVVLLCVGIVAHLRDPKVNVGTLPALVVVPRLAYEYFFARPRRLKRIKEELEALEVERRQRERQLKIHERDSRIRAKYPDARVAQAIIDGKFWKGQTKEQLIDSIGQPVEIDRHALKTKTKESLKYHRTAKNRFRLVVTVENNIVTEYDLKKA